MKIIIEKPCHENWDKMTPNEKGAFCGSCCKNVIDFSKQTVKEIKVFFSVLPATEKVCGRFKDEQLEEMSFEHFFKQFKKWQFLHKLAVILFFIFGTSLFSNAQINSNRHPHLLKGDVAFVPQDTVKKVKIRPDTMVIKSIPEPREPMTMGGPRFIPDSQPKTNPKKKKHVGESKIVNKEHE